MAVFPTLVIYLDIFVELNTQLCPLAIYLAILMFVFYLAYHAHQAAFLMSRNSAKGSVCVFSLFHIHQFRIYSMKFFAAFTATKTTDELIIN